MQNLKCKMQNLGSPAKISERNFCWTTIILSRPFVNGYIKKQIKFLIA
jgi:hypothetical protein